MFDIVIMMNKPKLIVITGMPGSGKTTIADFLGSNLSLPLIEKDKIKEMLFNRLGWSEREWSKKLGMATYDLMDYFIEQQLLNGYSVIIESNFKPEFDSLKFQKWKHLYNCDIIQILCHADNDILYNRFISRANSGERHPGHADANSLKEWKEFFSNPNNITQPIDVESKIKKVDTSDFSKVNLEDIVVYITHL